MDDGGIFAPTWPYGVALAGLAIMLVLGRVLYLRGVRSERARSDLRLDAANKDFELVVAKLVRNIDELHSTPDCRRPGTVELRRLMPQFTWPASVPAASAGSSPCGHTAAFVWINPQPGPHGTRWVATCPFEGLHWTDRGPTPPVEVQAVVDKHLNDWQ